MSQHRLIPGIIGGAGPGATTQLYLDIMARSRQAGLDHRPPVLIASLCIDLAMEERLLLTGRGVKGYLEPLLTAAEALTRGGAHFLAMPCNTLHLLLPELEKAAAIPVLSIVDAVVGEVVRAGCRRVGLMGTEATIRTALYQGGLQSRGIDVVCLESDHQEALARRIREEVGQGESPDTDPLGDAVVEFFQSQGAGAIIAGCTELKAVMAHWSHPLPVIDSLDSLGAAVVRRMLSLEPADQG